MQAARDIPPLFNRRLVLAVALALVVGLMATLCGNEDTARAFSLGERVDELDISLITDNAAAAGVWSDGETVWVADTSESKLYAYKMDPDGSSHGDRDSDKDVTLAGPNGHPRGLWSDGATMWVLDSDDNKVYAYTLSSGSQDTSKEFNLHSDNSAPWGIWSDGATMWVSDSQADKLFAYALSSGSQDTSKEFSLHSDNGAAVGIWSDGATIWVADTAGKLFAYALSGGSRDTSREFNLHSGNTAATGAWSDGGTVWIGDSTGRKLYAYEITRANLRLTITQSAHHQGVAGTGTHLYVTNGSDPDTIWVIDRSDNSRHSFETDANNRSVRGVWTDGVHVWAVEDDTETLYAYNLASETYASTENVSLIHYNSHPADLWGNDYRFYVLDNNDAKIYAYRRSDGQRSKSDEFWLHSDNDDPVGITSDGVTVWVVDDSDDKVYAYWLAGTQKGERRQDKEFDLYPANDNPRGTWSDGTHLHVIEGTDATSTLFRYDISDLVTPIVTLVVSPPTVSESGGMASVVATQTWPSSADTTITVSVDSDAPATLSANDALTIAAGQTTSAGVVTLSVSTQADDVFTGNRFVAVRGTAANEAGVQGPQDARFVVTDDDAALVEDFVRRSSYDIDALLSAGNRHSRGIWSDGATIWVADFSDEEIYAYRMNPGESDHGELDADKGFALHGDNTHPGGIWSDGETIWVTDSSDDKLYAYRMNPGESDHGKRDAGKEFELTGPRNNFPVAIWSDGSTIWVADYIVEKLFAYRMNPGGDDHGTREEAKEFDLDAQNDSPDGIWSDGTTIWVSDSGEDKLYAYRMNPGESDHGARVSSKDLDLDSENGNPAGVWSDGAAMWVADSGDEKLYAYSPPPPTVSLVVSPAAFTENGGTATVTASLDRTSTADTTITVSVDADAPVTLSANRVLTIPSGKTTSAGVVTITGQNDDVFTGDRFVALKGAATSAAEIAGPQDVEIVLTDDDAPPVNGFVRKSSHDIDALHDAGNRSSQGIWSDPTTIWVADFGKEKIFAYRMNPDGFGHGELDADKGFALHGDNTHPRGIWSDGATVWVADGADDKLYAYRMNPGGSDHGEREADKEIDLAALNNFPLGIWSDGSTIWVVDYIVEKLFAYRMNPGGDDHGTREEAKEFDLDAQNDSPDSIWSDGTTIWVSDSGEDKLYAYRMNPGESDRGARVSSKDLDLDSENGNPAGVWSDGAIMWVADSGDGKLYAYSRQPKATLYVSPAAFTENGGTATVTASLDRTSTADTTITVSVDADAPVTLSANRVLTIPSGKTTSAGVVTITGQNDDVFTGNRFVAVKGAAANTAGVLQPPEVRLVVRDDETVPLETFEADRDLDLRGLTAATNTNPTGIWSDRTTVWVADHGDDKLYAYSMNPARFGHGDRDSAKDLDLDDQNSDPAGIWSDGATMWVADSGDGRLYAYRMNPGGSGHGDMEGDKKLDLDADNANPAGIWSDGVTIWVADDADDKLYAYRMNPGGFDHGGRDSDRDITLKDSSAGAEDNGNPQGIWSDGATIWVADNIDDKLYAYDLDSRAHMPGKELAPPVGVPYGIWSDGIALWVVHSPSGAGTKVYTLSLAAAVRKLQSLTVGGVMVPGFDPDTTSYTVDLPYERRGAIIVTATALTNDAYVKLHTNGNSWTGGHREPATASERLEIGPNKVKVLVHDQCCRMPLGSPKIYKLTINRAYPPDPFGPFDDSLPIKGPGEAVPVNTDYCWHQREDGQDRMRCRYLYKHADRANARNIAVDVEVKGSTDSAIRGYRVLRVHYPLSPGSVWHWHSYDTPERDAMLAGAYVIREVPNSGTWSYFFDHDVEHGYCYLYSIQAVGGTEANPTHGPGYHWVDPASVSNKPRYHTERPPRCIPHYTGTDAPPDAPAAPQNLAATAGEAGIALTWDASAGADSYRVLRRNQDAVLYAEIATTTTNSYTDTTAVVAQGYAYKVQARNDSGDGEFSDHVLAMIDPPAPDAPTGLEAEVGDDSVTLSWDASDDDTIQSYMVTRDVRDADPPETVLLRRKVGETTQVTDSSPEAGAFYTYSVMAINAGGRSEAATVDVDIPAAESGLAAPTGLAATVSDGTVVLAWDAVEDATGYNVLRQGPGETAHTQLAAPTTNAYTDVAVSGGSSYSYQVQAVDDDGVGSLTDAVTADVPAPPDAPTNVQATATDSSVTLTWTAPGETLAGYFVYRKVRNADPPEDFTFHNAADAVDTTYTDATVEADTAYAYYIVAARSALELSEPSATVEVDTPAESPLTGFTLVDASNQNVLATLTGGDSVELADPDGGSYGIHANLAVGETVGSVKLELTGAKAVTRTENTAPYSLYGDSYQGDVSDLYGQALPAGSYTLTATAYAESGLAGDELGALEVSFTVTQANRSPIFGSATYNFSIAEDAATSAAVGTVSATDADSDGITYAIESGNGDGKFAINGSSGAITTAEYLDHETTSSYALTVQADDGDGGTATATVNVTVTDVDIDLTIRPTNLQGDNITHQGVDLSWDAPAGVAVRGYQILIRYAATDEAKTFHVLVENTQNTDTTYAVSGLDPETEHVFRVKAHTADGLTKWSSYLDVVTLPELRFDSPSYSFSIAEDVVVGAAVGTVSATDADDDGLTYSIESGNEDGKFATDGGTGAITTTEYLDHETDASYTLTVQAADGDEGTATATVNITVTDVDIDLTVRPTNLEGENITDESVDLSWDAPAGVVVRGYQVLIRNAETDADKTFRVLVENTQNTDTEYAVTGLTADTEYVFRVKAHTADGLTKWSSFLDIVTLPPS